MRLRNSFFILFLALFMGWLPVMGAETDPARRLWMSGYEAMTKADKSMEEDAQLAALRNYEKALDVFRQVEVRYPGWNTSLISYRIDYCEKKISAIKEANRNNIAYLTKEEIFAQLTTQAEESQALQEQVTQLKAELERNRQSLERARAEAASLAASEENAQILRKDRDAMAAQVRALTSQLSTLKEELDKARTPDPRVARVGELESQLKRSQEELASLGRTLEQVSLTRDDLLAQTQRDAQWRKQAEAQLAELRRLAEGARRAQEDAELQVQKMQMSVKALETENQNFREQREKTASVAENDMQQLQAQLRNREDQLQSARMDLLNVQRRLALAEESVTRLSEEVEAERDRSKATAEAMATQLGRAGQLGERNAELQDQTGRQAQTIAAQKELLATQEKEAARRQEEVDSLKKELSETTQRLSEVTQQLVQSQQQIAQAEQRVTQAEQRSAEVQSAKEEAETALRQSRDAALATEGIVASAQEAQAELEVLRNRVAQLEAQVGELSASLSRESQAHKEALERQQKLAAGQADAAASIWKSRSEELERALEAAQKREGELENALIRREQEKQSLERAIRESEKEREKQGNALRESEEKRKRQEQVLQENEEERKRQEQASLEKAAASAENPAVVEILGNSAGEGVSGEDSVLSPTDQVILRGFLRQGVDAEKAGKIEAAQWNYMQALSMQPDNFLALKRLGLLAFAAGNDGDTARYLSLAEKCNPDDGEVLLALGFSQLQLKQPQWALATLARAVALHPKDNRTMRLFGVALSTMEWREAASIQLKKAFELDEKDSESAFNLAMIGLSRSSELEFQARKDAAHREALERLAASLRHEALEWYRKAVAAGAQEDPSLEKALSR